MDFFCSLLFFLAAWLGHSIFWVAVVNRLHAYHIQRTLIDNLTIASAIILVGFPVVILLMLAQQEFVFPPAAWVSLSGVITFYLIDSVLLLFWASGVWVYYRLHSEKKFRSRHVSTKILDLSVCDSIPQINNSSTMSRLLGRFPYNQALFPQVEHFQVVIPQLPAGLARFKIAHLTDLHMSGRIKKEFFIEVVQQTNALEADLIVITGDIVEFPECVPWISDTLIKLKAKYGVYFIFGNHDRKVDHEALRQLLTQAGLKDVAKNPETLCVQNKAGAEFHLRLRGNELPWFPLVEVEPTSKKIDLEIALVHTPDQFAWAEKNKIDLVFAGHNHGGQICIPIFGALVTPSRFGTRYAGGTFLSNNTLMHVSRGVSGMTPIRLHCPPEITLVELLPASTDLC